MVVIATGICSIGSSIGPRKEPTISMFTRDPSYTDKILSRLTDWGPNGCQSKM